MKMGTKFLQINSILLGVILLLGSCNKEQIEKKNKKDQQAYETEEEEAAHKEQNIFLEYAIKAFSQNDSSNARLTAGENDICGAFVTKKKTSTHEEITLNFDGTINCTDNDTCKRQGVVQLQLFLEKGSNWSVPGAIITMVFHNYTFSYRDKGSEPICVNLSGTRKITNVSGGLVKNLAAGESIVHEIHATNMSLKFENSATSQWNASRKKTITKISSDEIQFVLEGIGQYEGLSEVASHGTDRVGNPYYVKFTAPITYRTCPGKLKIISGEKHRKGIRETTVLYGVNQAGIPVNNCSAYGFKVNWTTHSGEAREVIAKY